MRRSIVIDLDSESWPDIDCTVMVREVPFAEEDILKMFTISPRRSSRQAQYDIAYTDFEVQVTNVLSAVVRDMVATERSKPHGEQATASQGREDDARIQAGPAPQRVEERPQSKKAKAGNSHSLKSGKKRKVK